MQEVRAGVVAHGGAAHFVVDHGVHFVADVDGLLSHDVVRAHALHRIGHALDLGDQRVVIVSVEPANIADLAAGFSVERGVVEHDLAALAGLQLLCANAGAVVRLDDGQHLASGRQRLAIPFELGARQGLVERARRGLRAALPGRLGATALLFHGIVETNRTKKYSSIATGVFDEVTGQSECVIQAKRTLAWIGCHLSHCCERIHASLETLHPDDASSSASSEAKLIEVPFLIPQRRGCGVGERCKLCKHGLHQVGL